MLPHKAIHAIPLATLSLGGLLAMAGCTSISADKPYALTGNQVTDAQRTERLSYTDDKGRYRTDLRTAGMPPLRYVP
jgi:hypothetical protein